ncbi:MAG: hypothetical protein ABJ275_03445 [Maricaulaceae bacterium]
MTERNAPEIYQPTDAELKARNGRNIALALSLAGFITFVFITMMARSGAFG